MRILSDHPLALTHALLRPDTALAAIDALRTIAGKVAVDGLVELIAQPPTARLATAAIAALDGRGDPTVLDALRAALASPHITVRLLAVQALHQRAAEQVDVELANLLSRDEAWLVRRAALRALADRSAPARWQVLEAGTDPHWRVRHALIQALLRWDETAAGQQEIDERLAATGNTPRIEGVRAYLRYRWSGIAPNVAIVEEAPPWPFWDWDKAVLLRNLERLDEGERRHALGAMPTLLAHDDERVRALAVEALRRAGQTAHLARAVAQLEEPRGPAREAVGRLLGCLDLDRIEAVARFIWALPSPAPAQIAWAIDQIGPALPLGAEERRVEELLHQAGALPLSIRAALARLLARCQRPDAEQWLRRWLDDADEVRLEALRGLNQRPGSKLDEMTLRSMLSSPCPVLRAEAVPAVLAHGGELLDVLAGDRDVTVRARLAEALVLRQGRGREERLARLQADEHPHVRAAALTPERAAELVAGPAGETSWHVLARAARLRKVPLWELAPEPPWAPAPSPPTPGEPLRPAAVASPPTRSLAGLRVAPLGVSGHYGLPVEGFVRAVEAGVNLMFWEPNYQTLSEFVGRLSTGDRRAIHFVAGTFEADGKRVQRDAERVLRLLKLERVDIFMLFWVRSWARVAPDVREALENLRAAGKIGAIGLSTHSRPLALEALAAGWSPVMVRHSAAHRGAEREVFPRAVERGTGLITFNNTCYGRLLKGRGGHPPPSAADCYRYALAQPGVAACLSAPATLAQLDENLQALHNPELPIERRARLLEQGEWVYQEDTTFRALVRSR